MLGITKRWVTLLAMTTLLPTSATCQEEKTTARHFRMGFTGFPHDISIEAVIHAREFSRQNADIIAHHIEGVPWAELLAGQAVQRRTGQRVEGQEGSDTQGRQGLPRHFAGAG